MNPIFLSGFQPVLPETRITLEELARTERFRAEVPRLTQDYGYAEVPVSARASALEMAIDAAGRTLAAEGIAPSEVDAVVYCHLWDTEDWQRLACFRIHDELGLARHCNVFEVRTSNSNGALQSLAVADAMIRSEQARTVLVLTADKVPTNFMPRRSGSRIFGDGACAFVVSSARPGWRLATPVRQRTLARHYKLREFASFESQMVLDNRTEVSALLVALFRDAAVRAEDIGLIVTPNYERRVWEWLFAAARLDAGAWQGQHLARNAHLPSADIPVNFAAALPSAPKAPVLWLGVGIGSSYSAALLLPPSAA